MWWSNVFNNYPFFIFLWDRIGWMDNGICVCDWGIICGFVWNNIHVLLRNISQCGIRRLVMFLGPNISALRSKLFCSFMWNWKGRIDNMIRVRDRGIFDLKISTNNAEISYNVRSGMFSNWIDTSSKELTLWVFSAVKMSREYLSDLKPFFLADFSSTEK